MGYGGGVLHGRVVASALIGGVDGTTRELKLFERVDTGGASNSANDGGHGASASACAAA
jgi:hypothetical protein